MNELKPCPFCGGFVPFEVESHHRIYYGKCTECEMEFRYEEKIEYIEPFNYIQPNGIQKIRLPAYKVIKPFEEVWNRRYNNDNL